MYNVTATNKGLFTGTMEKNIFKTFHNSTTNDEVDTNKRDLEPQNHYDKEKINKKRKKHKVKERERDGSSMRKGEEVMHAEVEKEHRVKHHKKRGRPPKERTPDGEVKHTSGSRNETNKLPKTQGLTRQITGQNKF